MAHLLRDCSARSASSSLCRPCRTAAAALHGGAGRRARFFSSSASIMVGPESPEYVDVPQSLQPKHRERGQVKGTLPVPREVFPRRRPDKATQTYLDDVTKERADEGFKIPPNHPHAESREWKRRMGAVRRDSLRQGLKELYYRKRSEEGQLSARSRAKIEYARKVQQQPPREDERLTTPSTTEMMQDPQLVYGPDPDAEKHFAEKKARVAAKQDQKRQKRLEAIQTLYMNARRFITTEKQLATEIERVFPEGDNPDWANDSQKGDNIWNLGPPLTVEDMVGRMHNTEAKHELVQERMQKIAEKLTGGKLDDDSK